MKILSKNNFIKYSNDLKSFDKLDKLKTKYHQSSKWRREENSTFILLYETFFITEKLTGEIIVDYQNQLNLHCIFENVLQDAVQVLQIKEWIYNLTKDFLQENTGDYFNLLNFPNACGLLEIDEGNTRRYHPLFVESEVRSINRIINSIPFEKMTEAERLIAKMSYTVNVKKK